MLLVIGLWESLHFMVRGRKDGSRGSINRKPCCDGSSVQLPQRLLEHRMPKLGPTMNTRYMKAVTACP